MTERAPAVLAVDQGTTRTKAMIVDAAARQRAAASTETPLSYPRPGWVEQDPELLLRGVLESARAALAAAGDARVLAMGAAYLAGLGAGLWRDPAETAALWREAACYRPGGAGSYSGDPPDALYAQWLRAVERSRGWAEGQ